MQEEKGNLMFKELSSFGLLDGRMGVCIGLFVLGRERGNNVLTQEALELLDDIAGHIYEIDSINYGRGLAGIGYGVEWLTQNNFIQINTNEILSDIDDELYKAIFYTKNADFSLADGVLGKALFFLKRLQAKNLNTNRHLIICLNECLILLSDELHDFILNKENGLSLKEISEITDDEYLFLAQSLMFFEKLLKININKASAENGICGILKIMHMIFKEEKLCLRNNFIYLIHAYSNIALKLNDKELMIKGKIKFEVFLEIVKVNKVDIFQYYIHSYLCSLYSVNFDLEQPTNYSNITVPLLSCVDVDNYNWAEIYLLN